GLLFALLGLGRIPVEHPVPVRFRLARVGKGALSAISPAPHLPPFGQREGGLSIRQHPFRGGRELQERARRVFGDIVLGGTLRSLSHVAKLAAPAQPPAPDFTALQKSTYGPSCDTDLLNGRHFNPGGIAMVHIEKLASLIHQ